MEGRNFRIFLWYHWRKKKKKHHSILKVKLWYIRYSLHIKRTISRIFFVLILNITAYDLWKSETFDFKLHYIAKTHLNNCIQVLQSFQKNQVPRQADCFYKHLCISHSQELSELHWYHDRIPLYSRNFLAAKYSTVKTS